MATLAKKFMHNFLIILKKSIKQNVVASRVWNLFNFLSSWTKGTALEVAPDKIRWAWIWGRFNLKHWSVFWVVLPKPVWLTWWSLTFIFCILHFIFYILTRCTALALDLPDWLAWWNLTFIFLTISSDLVWLALTFCTACNLNYVQCIFGPDRSFSIEWTQEDSFLPVICTIWILSAGIHTPPIILGFLQKAENAKTINFALCLVPALPIFVKLCSLVAQMPFSPHDWHTFVANVGCRDSRFFHSNLFGMDSKLCHLFAFGMCD